MKKENLNAWLLGEADTSIALDLLNEGYRIWKEE